MDLGMRMAEMSRLVVLFFVTREIIVAYELKCPHSSQRRFRAAIVCNVTPASSYSCLYDIKNKIYIESCNQPEDFVLQGEKYVVSGGRLSNPCESDRYQPFNFWSSLQSICYYQKSLCYETGQLNFSQMSTHNDSICRCDYKNSYGFVTKPKNHCFCVPSEEDCACYQVQCPVETLLSSDYECKAHDEYEIDKRCEPIATKTLNNSLLSERKNSRTDIKADLTRESLPKVLFVAVYLADCLVVVLLIAVVIILCTDWLEDYCCFEEIKYMHVNRRFYKDIIGNWSYLISQLQPELILKALLKDKVITQQKYTETIRLDIENQNIFILLLFLQNSLSGHVRLFESLLSNQSAKLEPITVKRWPKRDETKCREKLHLVKDILAATNSKDFLNYCFQNFLFSPEDYEDVVKEGIKVESLKKKVDSTLTKGSIDCLKTFLEEIISKHENKTLLNNLEDLKKNLPPAILVDFATSSLFCLTTESDATEKGRWKNYRVQFSLLTTGERNISLMSSSRMLTCSKWFIQEIAMYPNHNSSVDSSSINLVPLVADAFHKLNKSISTKNLTSLLEIYLCGEEIIKKLSTKLKVQVFIQLKTDISTEIDSQSIEDRESVSQDFIENSSLFRHQREFLKKEIQPKPLLDVFPQNYKQHFKDIDLENGLRVDNAVTILDVIEENENKENLSACLLEVFKNHFPHIYARLKNIKDAYSSKTNLNIIRNMIRTFANLTNLMLELDDCQTEFSSRKYVDDILQAREDIDEQAMVKSLVRIIENGNEAIGIYIEFLYSIWYTDIIEMLLSTEEKYPDCCEAVEIVQQLEEKEIKLQANLQFF